MKRETAQSLTEAALMILGKLEQRHNENTGRKEWALVSRNDPSKVLEWYGTKKPSKERVGKSERRVRWFKNKG